MKLFAVALVAMFPASLSQAANWPQFRGPFFNGSTDESGLPTRWSQDENVAWVADLPAASAATPAIWGDHIFVSAPNSKGNALVAICFDRKTGKELWMQGAALGDIRKDHRSNFASPSPATDGEVAVFFYGTGDLVAYDFTGGEVWHRNLQEDFGDFAFQWTFSTSPLLYDGRLYIQVLQRDTAVDGRGGPPGTNKSYLLALDPKTGNTLWQQFRPSEARQESLEAFTTPVPFESNGTKQILVVGGDDLTGHDAENGVELWRWGTWNPERITHWRLVPSPVVASDVVLVCAPKRNPVYAIRPNGSGWLGPEAIAWHSLGVRRLTSDVPTPAYYDGDFFVLSDLRKALTRVEPASGEVLWRRDLPGSPKIEASPLTADGKVYLVDFEGTVVVVDAESSEILSQISMDDPAPESEPVRSGVIASQGQLFVKTTTKLFCIGE